MVGEASGTDAPYQDMRSQEGRVKQESDKEETCTEIMTNPNYVSFKMRRTTSIGLGMMLILLIIIKVANGRRD